MRRLMMSTLILAGLFGACAASAPAASAAAASKESDPVKVTGYLVKIEVAKDGKSAMATLVVKGKGKLEILVDDSLTLKKFKVKKIRTDDEIKCSYETVEGKMHSVKFLRAAGC